MAGDLLQTKAYTEDKQPQREGRKQEPGMSSTFKRFLCKTARFVLAMVFLTGAAHAQQFSALARVDSGATTVEDIDGSLEIDIALTQAVPFRLFTLTDPTRLVIDFREVDWSGLNRAAFTESSHIVDLRSGLFRPGWSRLVVQLSEPMWVEQAGMETDPSEGSAVVQLRLTPTNTEAFAASAGAPDVAIWGQFEGEALEQPIQRQTGDRPIVVVLDPGHGGIDPGAEREGLSEANLMLTFARSLKESLIRAGGFEVLLTRDSDVFVPLEARVSIARAARADVFLSLHADILPEGLASGATIYTLSDTATDEASARLAERHDREDLLAGVDLSDQDDVIASVLMDLARRDTAPRNDRLANALVEGIMQSVGEMYKHPRLTAGFSVLKAPDIPSVLIELGFLSSSKDLENLQSEEWRSKAVAGITSALQEWAKADAAEAQLIRQ